MDLPPAILVIFGITGDLAQRKLLPALYFLAKNELLPTSFRIVGVTRTGTSADIVVDRIRKAVELQDEHPDEAIIKRLHNAISIVKIDVTDTSDYRHLKQELDRLEDKLGVCLNRLYYLAIPSQMFMQIVRQLGTNDLNKGCRHGTTESRLLVEKPFGYDLESAHELVKVISHSFDEKDVYRIDHYLAKETVQNILTFRFQNPLFEAVWDKSHIDHITIAAAETIGIEGRVVFYEQMGALRDLVQSHLLQLLSLVTMERPKDFSAAAIHAAKLKLLDAIAPPPANLIATHTVRGQYEGYRSEVDNQDSNVETFAAVRLFVDNERWRGVPIVLQTGKKLTDKATEITITFDGQKDKTECNVLTIRIEPQEGITLGIRVKKPGLAMVTQEVAMDFFYSQQLEIGHVDGYERLIVDVLRGDKTLFATKQEILSGWRIIDPILEAWEHDRVKLQPYRNDSAGPRTLA